MKISFASIVSDEHVSFVRPSKLSLLGLMLALGIFNYALMAQWGWSGGNLWLATWAVLVAEVALGFEILRQRQQRLEAIWMPFLMCLLLLVSVLLSSAMNSATSVLHYLESLDPAFLIYLGMAFFVPLLRIVWQKFPFGRSKKFNPSLTAQGGAQISNGKLSVARMMTLLGALLPPVVYAFEVYASLNVSQLEQVSPWPAFPQEGFLLLLLAFAAGLGKRSNAALTLSSSLQAELEDLPPRHTRLASLMRLFAWLKKPKHGLKIQPQLAGGALRKLWAQGFGAAKRAAEANPNTAKRPSKALLLMLILCLFLIKHALANLWGLTGADLWLASMGLMFVDAALLFEVLRKDGQRPTLAWMPLVIWVIVLLSVLLSAALSQVESCVPYLLHAEPSLLLHLGFSLLFPIFAKLLQKFNSGDWLGVFGVLKQAMQEGRASLQQAAQSSHTPASTSALKLPDLPLLLTTVIGPLSYGMQLYDAVNGHAAGGLAQWPQVPGGHFFASVVAYISHLGGVGLNFSQITPLLAGRITAPDVAVSEPEVAVSAPEVATTALASPTHELMQQLSAQLTQQASFINELAERLDRLSKDHSQASQNSNRNLSSMQSHLVGIVSELKNAQQRQQRHADNLSALDRKLGDVSNAVRDIKGRR